MESKPKFCWKESKFTSEYLYLEIEESFVPLPLLKPHSDEKDHGVIVIEIL